MHRIRLAIAGALVALSLAACAALGAVGSIAGTAVDVLGTRSTAVSTTADKVILEGTRGLILAHNAYQGAANGLAPFVRAGRFSPATVNRIEALSNRAVFLLEKGDAGMTAAQRAAGVFAIADEFSRLAGK